jgi:hypothetical protein
MPETRARASAPRTKIQKTAPRKEVAPRRKPARAAKPVPTRNHKSAEAKKTRDTLDANIVKFLGQKRNKDGASKAAIAEALGADATAVKASLNRLGTQGLVKPDGATMNTVYLLAPKPDARRAPKTPAEATEEEE